MADDMILESSPWYLKTGELLIWKDTRNIEAWKEFSESMYNVDHNPNKHFDEPILKIKTKFDLN